MQFDISDIQRFSSTFGSPIYVFDEESFINNYRHFESCMKSVYKNYKISYSYKTNYAPYITRLVKNLGGYAEVVSDMELTIARKVGNDDIHIVYNGPCKEQCLEEFILNGGLCNVDNFEELDRIISFAQNSPNNVYRIGVRVNLDIGQGFISRFGIDDHDLGVFFEKVSNVPNVDVIGLHCHIGRSRSIDAWSKRAKSMIDIADRFLKKTPMYISLGSGMYGNMDPFLATQFGQNLPSYEDYAEAVCRPFADRYKNDLKPILFTEPGTTLINKYICFISKVLSVKKIKGKNFIVVNGSKHNLGELCELKSLPIQVVKCSAQNIVTNADLVGYTCLEHDVLYKGFSGDISLGDYVVFDNVGGYSNVFKPPFIKPNCCMISTSGAVIKRAESTEEIICTYE